MTANPRTPHAPVSPLHAATAAAKPACRRARWQARKLIAPRGGSFFG